MGENFSKHVSFTSIYNSLPNLYTNNTEYDKEKIINAIDKFKETLTFLDNKIITMNQNKQKYIRDAQILYKEKNKSGAIHQIKLKKMYEKEIQRIESIKFNIESNILHMESVSVMLETVSTIKSTSSHIQLINQNLDISKVEGIIEGMCEQKDMANDIESILSDTTTTEYDEEELLKELETFNDEPLYINDNTNITKSEISETTTNNSSKSSDTYIKTLQNNLPIAPTTKLNSSNDIKKESNCAVSI